MVGVQQWAEIRRLVLVEGLSQREVARRLGLARDTVARAVKASQPPRYVRAPAGSKLDPFRKWICEQLRENPSIPARRLREDNASMREHIKAEAGVESPSSELFEVALQAS